MPLEPVKCSECPRTLLGNAAASEHLRFMHRIACMCGHPRDRHGGLNGCCTKTTWMREGKMLDREQFCGCAGFVERPEADLGGGA